MIRAARTRRTPKVHRAATPDEPLDLRLVPAAMALWAGTFAGVSFSWIPALAGAGVFFGAAALVATHCRSPGWRRGMAVVGVCLVAGVVIGGARAEPIRAGPVNDLADAGAYAEFEAVVIDDPQRRDGSAAGRDGEENAYVVGRVRVVEITGRGRTHRVRTPVLVVSNEMTWASLLPGQRVSASGVLESADGPGHDVAAILRPRAGPEVLGEPGMIARATEPFREGLRSSLDSAGPDARGLVPGLVIGDESLMTNDLRADMRDTGLTHLTAVSGTNVTLVLVMALGVARWVGLRSYALPMVGLLCVAGFVLLARPEPSVLRAAAMGSVAVIGLAVAGRRRGVSALAAAALVLLLIDPWLARSVGFTLSVLATCGILVLVPVWQRSLRWLPQPIALAIAVPFAAQVACTPVLLAVSGELSLASLPANMLAAPAVGAATVFGVTAALVSPVSSLVASLFGWLASVPAWWIAAVAHWFADLPGATSQWLPGATGVVASVVLVLVAVVAVPRILRRPMMSITAAAVLVLALFRVAPSPGWPPQEWSAVACDVGQGDAVVLRVGDQSAVVVDAGREPRPVRRCLDSLEIDHVPLLVLSHFDIDHVGGVPGVLAGRTVSNALVSPLAEPEHNAAEVKQWLDDDSVATDVARAGERFRIGEELTVEVVWPHRLIDSSESRSNNASVVLDANVDGIDLLLTGDLEPDAQRALLRDEPDLTTDVLKVAHHGSPNQHDGLLTGVGADIALISVGENSYGHPSRQVLRTLRVAGMSIFRTDEDGSVALVRTGGDGVGVVRQKRTCRRRSWN